MKTILATATGKEMDSVLKGLGLADMAAPGQGQSLPVEIGGRSLELLVTGVGLVNAAFSLGRALADRADQAGVVNLGIAGSFSLDDLGLGCSAVVDTEIWPEYGLRGAYGTDPKGVGFSQWKDSESEIWGLVALDPDRAATDMNLTLPDLPGATSLTVAGVTGTRERAEHLRKKHGAILESMEGFALALGCLQAGVPFLELRSVSNLVGSRQGWDLKGALGELGRISGLLFFGQSG